MCALFFSISQYQVTSVDCSKRQQSKRPETTARAPQKRPASDSSPNDQKRQPVHRRTAPRIRSTHPRTKKQVVSTKNVKTCTYNAPQNFKKGNLVDKVVLLLTGAFFPPTTSKTDPPDQNQPGRNQHGWF